ncbi:MAG: pyridoxal-phosphate dependent enzyme [Chlorobi bacterium]|nr:pyridoxal-phosphate dependent enzyme [Chlorobiota bacterium]
MTEYRIPDITDIKEAGERIKGYIHNTPLLSSQTLNSITGADVVFKCENFQRAGAFKFRGACNAVFSLKESILKNGVATHSSGNHAAALSLAAKIKGIKAYVVMPENAPEIKKKAVAGYGAEITFCKPTLEARETTLQKVVKNTGATVIHPYNNFNVICGQGTAALEIQDVVTPDIVMAPVGGGGLISGTALAVKNMSAKTLVYGAEPSGADDAFKSFYGNVFVPSVNPDTIADGLLTSLGEINYTIIKRYVDEIFTASDDTIIKAMRLIWERMKIIVEPSSAVPLAVMLEHPEKFRKKKVTVIITGGNADLDNLPF